MVVEQKKRRREKEVKLPTEVWAIIAGKLDENDVCSFALVSKNCERRRCWRAGSS